MENKQNEVSNFLKAVDIVCMKCHYLSEETCANCPVRKTCNEQEKNNYGGFSFGDNKLF